MASGLGSPDAHRSFEFSPLQEARNYRAALIREFAPHLRARVLEIGAGVGHMTEEIRRLSEVTWLLAVEPDAGFCRELKRRLPDQPVLQATATALNPRGRWNAIVCVNVLEHIESDEKELRTYHALLAREQGALCLFVPARPEIYSPLDHDFGHYRRYTPEELRAKLSRAGFAIRWLSYFNSIGYVTWWLNHCVLKRRFFDPTLVKVFDRVVFPAIHVIEKRICRPPIGQSLIAVASAR